MQMQALPDPPDVGNGYHRRRSWASVICSCSISAPMLEATGLSVTTFKDGAQPV